MDSDQPSNRPTCPTDAHPAGRVRRESSATRRARAASRKPTAPAPGWLSAVDLAAWLYRGGWGDVSPATLARWQALQGAASFAGCWRSGGGKGRPNWYHPGRVTRWLYDTETRTYPGRELRRRLYPHPELAPRLFSWHWSAGHAGVTAANARQGASRARGATNASQPV